MRATKALAVCIGTFSVCLLISGEALARPAPQGLLNKIDGFIQSEMERSSIPGLSLAVLSQGKIIVAKGYGLANVELSVPATSETVYQLASVTKCFTATAIMQLIEDGKLALNDKITGRLDNLPKHWSEITVWHLLTHTSGIKNYTQLAAIADHPHKEFKVQEIIALVAGLPLEFAPGERYDYSNSGYYLLGLLIEKVSGRSYGAFLEQRIFKPTGMANTRVNRFSDMIPQRASGYVLRDAGIANGIFVNPSQPFAAGALVTSVADLAKWDAALATERILKKSTLGEMWAAAKLNNGGLLNYGLGWGVREREGRSYVQHNGGIIGFSTHLRRFLDGSLSIIVLANLSGREIYAEGIAEGITRLWETSQQE